MSKAWCPDRARASQPKEKLRPLGPSFLRAFCEVQGQTQPCHQPPPYLVFQQGWPERKVNWLGKWACSKRWLTCSPKPQSKAFRNVSQDWRQPHPPLCLVSQGSWRVSYWLRGWGKGVSGPRWVFPVWHRAMHMQGVVNNWKCFVSYNSKWADYERDGDSLWGTGRQLWITISNKYEKRLQWAQPRGT